MTMDFMERCGSSTLEKMMESKGRGQFREAECGRESKGGAAFAFT
jgi:hypothetical protein